MSPLPKYVQGCPICGRPLEIRVEYLGRWLNCSHCGGRFRATAGESAAPAGAGEDNALLRRVQELLELSDRHLHASPGNDLPAGRPAE